jgi:hypothetical protein
VERADKPNIWLHDDFWYCSRISFGGVEGFVGAGSTPLEAYWSWAKYHKLHR